MVFFLISNSKYFYLNLLIAAIRHVVPTMNYVEILCVASFSKSVKVSSQNVEVASIGQSSDLDRIFCDGSR